MAFPFCPVTDEILETLFWIIHNSKQTVNLPELHVKIKFQELSSILEPNSLHLEANSTNASNTHPSKNKL